MPSISGTVKDSNGNFAQRLVRAHRRDTGAIVSEGLSNPSTGAFSLTTNDTTKHYAVVHDNDAWITYLPFNGDNASTAFPEWGGKTVTAFGNAQISTAQSKFGGASAYFDGSGDYVSVPVSNDLAFGTGDFTIESFVRLTSLGVERALFDNRAAATDTGLYFYVNSSNQLTAFGNNATIVTGTATALTATTWHHVALVKSNGTITLYLNGVAVGSAASAYSITCPSAAVIGRKIGSTTNDWNGHLDDLRISKGKAQYIANFNPPTAPHFTATDGDPYWNNVVLGCHFDSGTTPTFKDVATGKTITAYGGTAISSAQSKFGGASAYFDGNGDYLTVSYSEDFNVSGKTFTIEAWVYRTLASGNSTYACIVSKRLNGGDWDWGIEFGGNSLSFKYGDTGTASGSLSLGTVPLNTWVHIAVSVSSGTIRTFLDGNIIGTATVTGSIRNRGIDLFIGRSLTAYADNQFQGYIEDLRITNGVARYITNFTPPTAPFPEVLQTFGQQNAMIYDHLTPV